MQPALHCLFSSLCFLLLPPCYFSQKRAYCKHLNHRITEWPGLKRTTMIIWFQPPAVCRVANQQPRLPRATSSLALNACRDGASTASLGNLFSASPPSGGKSVQKHCTNALLFHLSFLREQQLRILLEQLNSIQSKNSCWY